MQQIHDASKPKIVIMCLDGLTKEDVDKGGYENLGPRFPLYGHTDITGITPRSVVLWSYFLSGKNLESYLEKDVYRFRIIGPLMLTIPYFIGYAFEKKISSGSVGKILSPLSEFRKSSKFHEMLWKFRLRPRETFFRYFRYYSAIDMVAFTQDQKIHAKSRELIGDVYKYDYYVEDDPERIKTEDKYKNHVWGIDRRNERATLNAIDRGFDAVLLCLYKADMHMNYGIMRERKKVYDELNSSVGRILEKVDEEKTVVIGLSDHCMQSTGIRGDHFNVKHGTYFISRTLKRLTEDFEEMRENLRAKSNWYTEYDIDNALEKLENGDSPTLKDLHNVVKIYGNKPTSVRLENRLRRRKKWGYYLS